MKKLNFGITLLASLFWLSCSDEEVTEPVVIPEQPEEIAGLLQQYNTNVAALQLMAEGDVNIVDYTEDGESGYKLTLDNNWIVGASSSAEVDNDIPVMGINEAGYWVYQLNGTQVELTDVSGNAVPALRKTGKGVFTPQIALGEDGCWKMSLNGVQWKNLSTDVVPSLEAKTAASYSLFKSASVTDGVLSLQTAVGELSLNMDASASTSANAWKKFMMKAEDNVLLDFSYAGYEHGNTAPVDGFSLGYKVYNVQEVMQNNNLNALQAFTKILDENKLIRKTTSGATNENARIVIYFPEGEYVLHEGEGKNFPYDILGGHFVIKGAGKDKTRLVMMTPNGDTEKTNAPLLTIKHTNSPTDNNNSPQLALVTANAKRGDFQIKVSSTTNIKPGKWVQLRLRSGSKDLLAKELGPLRPGAEWSITKSPVPITESNEDEYGIKITEFHQVKAAHGDMITFYEPIMHDIDIQYNDCLGWEIREYRYYEQVGIEDLTFVGQAVTPYYHHGEGAPEGVDAWKYDQEYRPVSMIRLVNSWVRNVDFESVSEAVTFSESANCSAYNIEIRGHRGHGAVRAAGSTRVFIGKISDVSSDSRGDGQWHGCGVSKPSIGNVIWNSNWGSNACFESHATQPRATLFDNCRGGLVRYHAGGAETEAPNHLSDLTLWNLEVTGTIDEKGINFASDFKWWDAENVWWKIYPPIVVGTHGQAVTFSQEEGQLTYEESTGVKVTPESLYEAQLQKRLGYVPAWLNALK